MTSIPARRRPADLLVLGTLLTGAVVVLVCFRQSGGAMPAVLALSVLSVAEWAVVLMALRRADRITAEIARRQIGYEHTAAALALDLRDELALLHRELARVAAQTAIAASAPRVG
ncbi:hypothetical protein Aph02nite_24400 [Actinoplanes philippinensis]|uniref:Uncharacterized protein n=1 Tax=Actinoplanes philippinensis TaxID=35752 RepID=A0A1I2G1E6_9ACTN|nr:hypothetical protein [Actinoplanes philippinensis]GIE76490.1 hypothetical protein Aph02nite_24400 [Actinoplanes philippinensis]SFF10923.1 hypothetical protein SAMN05421541_10699 [Actinoplanes philippinensis]